MGLNYPSLCHNSFNVPVLNILSPALVWPGDLHYRIIEYDRG